MDKALPDDIEQVEAMVALMMPQAADMVATVVEDPTPSMESYAAWLELAEANPGFLLLALLRFAAGLAAVCEATPGQIRGLGAPGAGDETPASDE